MPKNVFSITQIDHLGNSFCLSHDIDKDVIQAQFDRMEEELGDWIIWVTKVYSHYDFCCFCHWSLLSIQGGKYVQEQF